MGRSAAAVPRAGRCDQFAAGHGDGVPAAGPSGLAVSRALVGRDLRLGVQDRGDGAREHRPQDLPRPLSRLHRRRAAGRPHDRRVHQRPRAAVRADVPPDGRCADLRRGPDPELGRPAEPGPAVHALHGADPDLHASSRRLDPLGLRRRPRRMVHAELERTTADHGPGLRHQHLYLPQRPGSLHRLVPRPRARHHAPHAAHGPGRVLPAPRWSQRADEPSGRSLRPGDRDPGSPVRHQRAARLPGGRRQPHRASLLGSRVLRRHDRRQRKDLAVLQRRAAPVPPAPAERLQRKGLQPLLRQPQGPDVRHRHRGRVHGRAGEDLLAPDGDGRAVRSDRGLHEVRGEDDHDGQQRPGPLPLRRPGRSEDRGPDPAVPRGRRRHGPRPLVRSRRRNLRPAAQQPDRAPQPRSGRACRSAA